MSITQQRRPERAIRLEEYDLLFSISYPPHAFSDPADGLRAQIFRPIKATLETKVRRGILTFCLIGSIAMLCAAANSQSLPYSPETSKPDTSRPDTSSPETSTPSNPTPDTSATTLKNAAINPPDVTYNYMRPTRKTQLDNFVFDAFGPYPIGGAALAAGLNQFTNSPPEWQQGVEGYSKRFGSNFGIAAVATTTRYGLAEALKEDTLYYRCDCTGIFPRVRHALFSTLTARQGSDGHRVFSLPALIAPYAGTMTAVYAWYPNRYGAKDAFRMGSYSLLAYAGSNISLEFFYSGPHSLLTRMHLNNSHAAPDPGPNHTPDAGSKP
jgi:hypothetical protein